MKTIEQIMREYKDAMRQECSHCKRVHYSIFPCFCKTLEAVTFDSSQIKLIELPKKMNLIIKREWDTIAYAQGNVLKDNTLVFTSLRMKEPYHKFDLKGASVFEWETGKFIKILEGDEL